MSGRNGARARLASDAHRVGRARDDRADGVGVAGGEDARDLPGQARVAARAAARHGEAGPQALEELLLRAGARHRRERASHVGEGVGVAAADGRHARLAAHDPGPLVVALRHRPVQGLDEGQPPEGQPQVGELAGAGERGEEVVDGGGQALLGQEREEGLEVGPPGLEALVLPLVQAEHVDVELSPALEERRVTSSLTKVSGRWARESAPSIVSWSVSVTRSMPRPASPLVHRERIGVAFPADVLAAPGPPRGPSTRSGRAGRSASAPHPRVHRPPPVAGSAIVRPRPLELREVARE